MMLARMPRFAARHEPLEACVGRILAEDVHAERDHPPFDRVTMDGIAIGNGILTVENEAQALVRADPAQLNKGAAAAEAAMALLAIQEKFA